MGLRDKLLALKSDTKLVETEAGTVLVRGATLALKDRMQAAAVQGRPWRGLVLLHCCLDPETEEPLFSDDDLGALNDMPHTLEKLVDAVIEVSAISDEDIEELEGN